MNDVASASDYEEVIADHRRLVAELDLLLNGFGAAPQASLCDLVSQMKRYLAQFEIPLVKVLDCLLVEESSSDATKEWANS